MNRAMGIPGVGLGILKQRGSNAVEVAKAVRAKMVKIQAGLPEGMKLAVNLDSTKYSSFCVQARPWRSTWPKGPKSVRNRTNPVFIL